VGRVRVRKNISRNIDARDDQSALQSFAVSVEGKPASRRLLSLCSWSTSQLESKHDQRNQPIMAHSHRSRELPSGQAAYIARVGASGTRQGSHPQWHTAHNVALFALRFGCYTPIASRALTKWRIELRERHKTGSVVFDKARGTWRFLQWVEGKRKSQTIGTKQESDKASTRCNRNRNPSPNGKHVG
jgi:hypothetical protein